MADSAKSRNCLPQRVSQTPRASSTGLTLLEMAMAMMIVAVLSVGVSSLVRTAMETQLSERSQQQMQLISKLIVDDLRRDFQQADSVTVSGGGSILKLLIPESLGSSSTYLVTYSLNSSTGQLSRNAQNKTKIYNDPDDYPGVLVKCSANCFTMSASNRLVTIDWLRVAKTTDTNSVIDQKFGAPNYLVRDLAFDIASENTFQ